MNIRLQQVLQLKTKYVLMKLIAQITHKEYIVDVTVDEWQVNVKNVSLSEIHSDWLQCLQGVCKSNLH